MADNFETKPVFRERALIDVTNFYEDEKGSVGYTLFGDVSIFANGDIITVTDFGDQEKLHVSELVHVNNNINNYDPKYELAIKIVTMVKAIKIELMNKRIKSECWNTLIEVYDAFKNNTV